MYQSFSDTFLRPEGFGISGATLGGLVAALPVAYLLASYGFWKLSKMFLPNLDIKTRCAATFCSSQKTMAFGIPLIKAVFGETNNIAVLIAPILILTPVQLMLCSGVIVPVMRRSINKYNAQQEEMKTKLLSSGLMLRGGYTSHQDHINKQNSK